MFRRIVIVVLDSLGVGALPDAADFGDSGSDTVGHVNDACGLVVPHLSSLGLSRIAKVPGEYRAGAYGRNAELSAGLVMETLGGSLMIGPVFPSSPRSKLTSELDPLC